MAAHSIFTGVGLLSLLTRAAHRIGTTARAALARVRAAVASTAADVVVLVGLGAVVYGVSQWSVPMAWVLGGAFLAAVGIRAALRSSGGDA